MGKGKAWANDALSEQGGEYSELQVICKGGIWVGGQCKPGSKAAGNSTIDSLSQQGLETSSCKMMYVEKIWSLPVGMSSMLVQIKRVALTIAQQVR